ncbi:MAG: hypothetical protein BWY63_03579 [Chloroflexi bacterium ADurb.Bin360]|nr:MAG: hypothetical protein BWY63_03579 [Chloroflexi bacterium ADurb.Bin360]
MQIVGSAITVAGIVERGAFRAEIYAQIGVAMNAVAEDGMLCSLLDEDAVAVEGDGIILDAALRPAGDVNAIEIAQSRCPIGTDANLVVTKRCIVATADAHTRCAVGASAGDHVAIGRIATADGCVRAVNLNACLVVRHGGVACVIHAEKVPAYLGATCSAIHMDTDEVAIDAVARGNGVVVALNIHPGMGITDGVARKGVIHPR